MTAKKRNRRITGTRTEENCPAPGCGNELAVMNPDRFQTLDIKSSTGMSLRLVFCTSKCLKAFWDEWITQKSHECIRHVGW